MIVTVRGGLESSHFVVGAGVLQLVQLAIYFILKLYQWQLLRPSLHSSDNRLVD